MDWIVIAPGKQCTLAAFQLFNILRWILCLKIYLCFLLMNGELPNAAEKAQFESTISNHTMVHEQLINFFNGFRRDAHPMAIMVGVVGALSSFYHDALDNFSGAQIG